MDSNARPSTPPHSADPADLFTPESRPRPSSPPSCANPADLYTPSNAGSSPLSEAPDSDDPSSPVLGSDSPPSTVPDNLANFGYYHTNNNGAGGDPEELCSLDTRASPFLADPFDRPWPTPLRQLLHDESVHDDEPMDMDSANEGAGGDKKEDAGGAGGVEEGYVSEEDEEIDELESSKPPTPAVTTPSTRSFALVEYESEADSSVCQQPSALTFFNTIPRVDGGEDDLDFDVDGFTEDDDGINFDLDGPANGGADADHPLASVVQVGGGMREATPPKHLTPTRLRAVIVPTERANAITMGAVERRRIPPPGSFMPGSPPPPSSAVLPSPSSPTPVSASSKPMPPPPVPAKRAAMMKKKKQAPTPRGRPPAEPMGPPPPPPPRMLPPSLPAEPNIFQTGPAGSPPPIPPEEFHGRNFETFAEQGGFSDAPFPSPPPSDTALASLTAIDEADEDMEHPPSTSRVTSGASSAERRDSEEGDIDSGGRPTNKKQEILDTHFETMFQTALSAARETGFTLSRVLKAFGQRHIAPTIGRSPNKWNGYQTYANRTAGNRIQERKRIEPDYIFDNKSDPDTEPPALTTEELQDSWKVFQQEYTAGVIEEILNSDKILGIIEGDETLAARQRKFDKIIENMRRMVRGITSVLLLY